MTPLGALTLLAIVLCLKDWRTRFPWLLSATLTLPITAAIALPGLQLTPFFIVALALSVLLGWEWIRGRVELFGWPGATVLVALVAWVALVTLAGPALFAGTEVLNNRVEAGGLVSLTTLGYTGSNVAQPAYLGLSAVVICFLATRSRLSLHLFLPGLIGCMSLSFWRLLSDKTGLYFPAQLTDSGDYSYIDIATETEYRLRGVFTEPSTLAHYATAAFALSLVMLYTQRPGLRLVYAGLAVVSAVNIVFTNSGTAVVGGAAVLAVTVTLIAIRAGRTGRGLWSLSIAACATAIAALVFYRPIGTYAATIFTEKVASDSYDQRTFSDAFSLRLFVDTWGLGVGLGSNKPSGLWTMMLSCTGVVGTLLFAALVLQLVVRAARTSTWLGAAVVAASLVISKSVAGSFLSEPLMVLGLAVCAHAAQQAHLAHRSRPGPDDPPAPPARLERAPERELVPALSARAGESRRRDVALLEP